MICLGLDPGSERCGFAVLKIQEPRLEVLELGVWSLKNRFRLSLGLRLEEAAKNLEELLKKYNPHCVGLEKAVFFKNASSSMVLSELRGVLRLVLYQNLDHMDERLFELSPTAVKRVSTGLGLASKQTVLKALQYRFQGLEKICSSEKLSFDAFDALAVAYTAFKEFQRHNMKSNFQKMLKDRGIHA